MKLTTNARYNDPIESGTIFRGKVGVLDISIHRIIHFEGWFLSCHALGLRKMKLKSNTLSEAIEESKKVLKKTADILTDDVNSFCEQEVEMSRY